MPNAKVLNEKKAVVAALTERIRGAESGVLVDYKGINVAQDTELRTELRKNEVEYSVIKNTLTRFALDDCGLKELDPVLHGTTSLATSKGDPIAPFRIISEFSKKVPGDAFSIKAAFMDGRVLTPTEIEQISALPSKDVRRRLLWKVLNRILKKVPIIQLPNRKTAVRPPKPRRNERPAHLHMTGGIEYHGQ